MDQTHLNDEQTIQDNRNSVEASAQRTSKVDSFTKNSMNDHSHQNKRSRKAVSEWGNIYHGVSGKD